ncbi:methyl-accepting chemotaxis protein [bacterium]|nr:methyl-accepting chemotaxis protein [bacterium]
MSFVRNLSIRLRLALAFLLMVALLIANGLSGLLSARQVHSEIERIHTTYLPALDYLLEADRDLQQLLVSERTLLEAEPGSEQFNALLADYEENMQQSHERWLKYIELAESAEEQEQFPLYDSSREAWLGLTTQVVQGAASSDPAVQEAARELSRGESAAAFETMRDVLDRCTELNIERADQARDESAALVKSSEHSIVGISLASILLSIVLAVALTRRITIPLSELVGAARAMAAGDFSIQLAGQSSADEIGNMRTSFIEMKDNTRELISQLANEAQSIAASSEELAAAADENNRGVQQVAELVSSIAEGARQSVDNMQLAEENLSQTTVALSGVSQDVQDVASFATQTAAQGEAGRDAAGRAVQIIKQAADSVKQTTGVVEKLGERTAKISEFISIITSIADQTNLLALNAAIEAARAGEAGRGFAVVAEEVRKLAEESNSAAGSITELVRSINSEMDVALRAMSQSDQEVTEGASTVSEAGEMFSEIVRGVQSLNEKVQSISATTQQLNASSNEVTSSVGIVGQAAIATAEQAGSAAASTEQQRSSMEEIGSSTNLLARSAEQLSDLVHRFKV